MSVNLRRLKDKVAQAGARVERARLNLDLATRELEAARRAVLSFDGSLRYEVRLTAKGPNLIGVVKAIRSVTAMSLKEAKEITDCPGSTIKKDAREEEVQAIRSAVEEAGGVVQVLPVG